MSASLENHVATCLLRNTGTDPSCSREVGTALCKNTLLTRNVSRTSRTEFSGSAHVGSRCTEVFPRLSMFLKEGKGVLHTS